MNHKKPYGYTIQLVVIFKKDDPFLPHVFSLFANITNWLYCDFSQKHNPRWGRSVIEALLLTINSTMEALVQKVGKILVNFCGS